MKKLVALLLLVSPLAAACNTVEGFGQDVEKAGSHIERRADEAK